MRLIIDGYNVLHLAGLLGPTAVGPGELEHARLALLELLVAALDPAERQQTTVVFDANNPPRDRPRSFRHKGVEVEFAPREEDADTLIEELIRAESAPRRLVVVSSDRRIQRAARRRKATAVEAAPWFDELTRRRPRTESPPASESAVKPEAPLPEAEVLAWLRAFGFDEERPEPPPGTPRGSARDAGRGGYRR